VFWLLLASISEVYFYGWDLWNDGFVTDFLVIFCGNLFPIYISTNEKWLRRQNLGWEFYWPIGICWNVFGFINPQADIYNANYL